MKIVVFDNPDGSVTLRYPADPATSKGPTKPREGETPDEWFERITAGPNRKGGVRVGEIDSETIPLRRRILRGSLRWNGTNVVVDMAAARVLKLDHIREERNRRLDETDKEVFALDGRPLPPALAAKRQALRDLPQNIDLDSITDINELENFEPVWPV